MGDPAPRPAAVTSVFPSRVNAIAHTRSSDRARISCPPGAGTSFQAAASTSRTASWKTSAASDRPSGDAVTWEIAQALATWTSTFSPLRRSHRVTPRLVRVRSVSLPWGKGRNSREFFPAPELAVPERRPK